MGNDMIASHIPFVFQTTNYIFDFTLSGSNAQAEVLKNSEDICLVVLKIQIIILSRLLY